MCRLKKITNPTWYQKYLTKNNKYNHYSPDWIKKVIVPSKAFRHWLKIYLIQKSYQEKIRSLGKQYLPSWVKITLKRNFPIFFYTEIMPIPPKIDLEWNKWLDLRSDKSLDIIDFGIIAYHYRLQRPQHLAREMTYLGHRVFYIENEFVFSPSATRPQISVNKCEDNLYTVKLSSSKNYFIYSDVPSDKDRKIIISSLKLLLRKARILNPIAKIDHPFWASIANELSMPIIYDIMDLHSGFSENSKANLYNEQKLLDKSNLILASSDYLVHRFSRYSKKLITLKNAGEYSHFLSAAKPARSTPVDIKSLNHPVIGYYGALADWLDTNLIEGLAKDFPICSIVLIGMVTNPTLLDLAKKYPNIRLLGEKPYHELPKYLTVFDVCLIPFKLTKLIQATNPVKIYEYFASGKPVVATSIPELLPFKKLVYFADNPRAFTRAIRLALAEKSLSLSRSRQQIASSNTWHDRAAILEKSLMELYPKVSVVILIYNHADLSQISLDSTLLRSKYPNFEVLAVDNFSDQATIQMLQKYKNNPKVKLIFNSENYGFARGNNVGMRQANGQYIILLNNDVRVTPGWIERLIYHAKARRVGLVGPVTNSIGNESKISIWYDPENQIELEEQAANYTYSHWGQKLNLRNIAAFAWLQSKKLFKTLGGLDERFGRGLFEDDDYCMRVKNAGLEIICAEDSFVHHYGGASTGWGSPEYQKLFNDNKIKFEQKWGTKWIPHRNRKNL